MSKENPPVNFRDVGEYVRIIGDSSPLPMGRLFRGGKIDEYILPSQIGHSRTIINLRRGVDPSIPGIDNIHVPATDSVDNYNTSSQMVRKWIRMVLNVLTDKNCQWPLYVHCTSGRDRTGVIVASILHILDHQDDVIRQEYMASVGGDISMINLALDGLKKWGGLRETYRDLLLKSNLCL